MSKLYPCCTCKRMLPLTDEHYFRANIDGCTKYPERTSAGKCKPCAKEYGDNYRKNLLEKRLTRKNVPPKFRTFGILYIIGTTPDNPVKIGVTSGNSTRTRLVSLQTSHWLDLKVLYETPVFEGINKMESTIHKVYKKHLVRGEWYNIPEDKLKKLIEGLQKKF